MKEIIKQDTEVGVLLVGGFGHAVCVFDEWLQEAAAVRLVGAVQTLPEESLDGFLAHPWCTQFKPSIYHDIEEALRLEQPDLVVVSTRPDLNSDLIELSLRAGSHVIAEKPIAVNASDLLRLQQVVKETGRWILPMLGLTDSLAFVAARELMQQGAIGEPLLVNVRKSYQWGKRAEWFKQPKTYGGIWGWVGISAFRIAEYVTGRHLIQILAAQESNGAHPEYAPGCPDALTGLFLLQGAVQMTASIDLLRPDGQPDWADDWIRVVGTQGSLEALPGHGTIRLIRPGQDEELRSVSTVAPLLYTPFLKAVTAGADFYDLTQQGFQLTDAALSASRASIEGHYGMEVDPGRWNFSNLHV